MINYQSPPWCISIFVCRWPAFSALTCDKLVQLFRNLFLVLGRIVGVNLRVGKTVVVLFGHIGRAKIDPHNEVRVSKCFFGAHVLVDNIIQPANDIIAHNIGQQFQKKFPARITILQWIIQTISQPVKPKNTSLSQLFKDGVSPVFFKERNCLQDTDFFFFQMNGFFN